jgi:hypothetical protein
MEITLESLSPNGGVAPEARVPVGMLTGIRTSKFDLDKDEVAMARKAKKVAGEGIFTPKKARNALSVAKVIGPAVLPVVAPFAVQAAGALREAYDRHQARKLGIEVERLGEFTGRGAALHARISGVSEGLAELKKSAKATDADIKFVNEAQGTLEQLAASVRASERMPAQRRKSTARAVAGELDQLESQLLHRFGL